MQARRRRNPNAFQLRASLDHQFARVRLSAIEAEHCETLRRLPSAEREKSLGPRTGFASLAGGPRPWRGPRSATPKRRRRNVVVA